MAPEATSGLRPHLVRLHLMGTRAHRQRNEQVLWLRKRVNDSQAAGDSREKEVQERHVPGPSGRDARVAARSEPVKPESGACGTLCCPPWGPCPPEPGEPAGAPPSASAHTCCHSGSLLSAL